MASNAVDAKGIRTDSISSLTPGQPIKMGAIVFGSGTTIHADVVGDVTGDVVGDITGNVTGGNITGNIASITRLIVSNGSEIPFVDVDIDMQGNSITNLPLVATASSEAVSKAYVDSALSGNIWKEAVVVATTANLAATYVGSPTFTLTATAVGVLTVDGQTPGVGDRVLVANQTTATQNGVYTVTDAGSGATQWIMTRASDYDSDPEIGGGDSLFVQLGATFADYAFIMTNYSFATLDTDTITWSVANRVDNPLTTKGDLFGYGVGAMRIPVGLDGQILTADSAQPSGITWATSPTVIHGSLVGLAADDHAQYALLAGRGGDVLNMDTILGVGGTSSVDVATVTLASAAANEFSLTQGATSLTVNGSGAWLVDQSLDRASTPWFAAVNAAAYSAVPATAAELAIVRGRGTMAVPLSVQAGDTLGQLSFKGMTNPANPYTAASIRSIAETTFNAVGTSESANLVFSTVKTGAATDVMRINADKITTILTADPSVGAGTGALQVVGGIYAGAASVFGAGITTTDGMFTGSSVMFMDVTEATPVSAPVTCNGGLLVAKSLYANKLGLPPIDGTQQTVDGHDEFTAVLVVTGGAVAVPISAKVFRFGKFVCLQLPAFTVLTTAAPGSLAISGVPLLTAIPASSVSTLSNGRPTVGSPFQTEVEYDTSIGQILYSNAEDDNGYLPTAVTIDFKGCSLCYVTF